MKGLSRRKAFREYLRDFHAVDHPGNYSAEAKKEVYAEIRETLDRAKGRLAATVRATCYNCVGGVDSEPLLGAPSPGGDPGGRERVRDCTIAKCSLHPVRPWQNLKGRPRKAGEDSDPDGASQTDQQGGQAAKATELEAGAATGVTHVER
jgi:hypothetical protein